MRGQSYPSAPRRTSENREGGRARTWALARTGKGASQCIGSAPRLAMLHPRQFWASRKTGSKRE
jgi:hypothetical protein